MLEQEGPSMLRDRILREITGGTLRVLRCTSCCANFTTDMPKNPYAPNYHCTVCGLTIYVQVVRYEATLLKAAFAPPQEATTPPIVVRMTPLPKPRHIKMIASGGGEKPGPVTEPKQCP